MYVCGLEECEYLNTLENVQQIREAALVPSFLRVCVVSLSEWVRPLELSISLSAGETGARVSVRYPSGGRATVEWPAGCVQELIYPTSETLSPASLLILAPPYNMSSRYSGNNAIPYTLFVGPVRYEHSSDPKDKKEEEEEEECHLLLVVVFFLLPLARLVPLSSRPSES